MPTTDIKSMTLEEIEEVTASMSLPKFRAAQIFSWLQQYGAMSYDEMTNISKDLRHKLSETYPIYFCEIELKQVSKIDGTVKYLFRLHDGNYIDMFWL